METKIGPPLHATWDVVFGRPHAKYKNLPAKAQEKRLLWPVYAAVLEMRAKEPRQDAFPGVAKRFAISVALCRKYFRRAYKLADWGDERGAQFAKRMIEAATNFKNK